jgi:hypothetical protein
MATAEVYIATQSGASDVDGETYVFTKGSTRVRAGHPLLRAVPDYFEPVDDHIHYDVEQATRAPGEKRRRAATETPEVE